MTTVPPVYELYGLRVSSEVKLSAPFSQNFSPDLTLRWGENYAIPKGPPPGEVLLKISLGRGRGYTFSKTREGYTIRFDGTCEFRISPDRCSVRVHLAPGKDPAFIPLLFSGSVLALLLGACGESILHASAVQAGEFTLAFVGNSGMGKSTLAALFCANGARFVTDDVLRLDFEGDDVNCFAGTPELRLRPSGADLVSHFPEALCRVTVDQRKAICLGSDLKKSRLNAIIIPRPSRTVETSSLKRLSTSQAFFSLSRYACVHGWRAKEPLCQQFNTFARLSKSFPIYEAEIPWGPPFDLKIPAEILAGAGLCVEPAGVPI